MKSTLVLVLVLLTTSAWPQTQTRQDGKAATRRTEASGKAAGPAYMQPIRALVAAMNGRQEFPAQLFTDDAAVIDEFPPFVWQGPGGAKAWYGTFLEPATNKHPDERITIGAARRLNIKNGVGYLTVPATIAWTDKGKKKSQAGHWTFVLQQDGAAWKIAAHSFDIVSQTP